MCIAKGSGDEAVRLRAFGADGGAGAVRAEDGPLEEIGPDGQANPIRGQGRVQGPRGGKARGGGPFIWME
jgi:hypothetical protein